MCRSLGLKILVVLLVVSFGPAGFAQYPYTFNEQSHNTQYGEPYKAALGRDSLVFLSSKSVLRAYKFNGNSFAGAGYLDGTFGDVAFGDDGTLFAYTYPYGLAAYKFNNSAFQLISSIKESWGPFVLGNKGDLFFANSEYITAYKFNGTDFSLAARVPNLAPYSTTLDLSPETFLSVTADSMVYAAGAGGVYLYKFTGDSLILTDSVKMYVWRMDVSDEGVMFLYGKKTFFDPNKLWVYVFENDTFINKAEKQVDFSISFIKTGNDGNIFIGADKLNVFKYKGDSLSGPVVNSSFNNIKDITLDNNGIIFLSDSKSGLHAITYNDTAFTSLADIPSAGSAEHVIISDGGSLLLSNSNGIYDYSYRDGQITDNAFIQFGSNSSPAGYVYEAVEASNNTIITAGGYDGIRAFKYENGIFTNLGHITGNPGISSNIGYPVSVAVSKDGIIFAACSDFQKSQNYGIHALRFDGNEFSRVAYKEVILDTRLRGNGCVRIDSSENIFLGGDRLTVYSFKDSIFTEIASLDNGMPVTSIAFGSDNVIFLAQGNGGISAYRFNGTSFTLIRHMETGNLNENSLYEEKANDIAISNDGTIFLANGKDGLRALSFKGDLFQLAAHYGYEYGYYSNGAAGVTIGPDGTIYLANSDYGLRILTYTPVTDVTDDPVVQARNYKLYQNYPNPFNPETRIKYFLPAEVKAELSVYNILGEKVLTLVNGMVTAGEHELSFNAGSLPNGVYIYRLKAGDYTASQKMVLIK